MKGRTFNADASGQTAHATARLDHVFERDQKSRAILLRENLCEVFRGITRVFQPFEQIVFVISKTHVL